MWYTDRTWFVMSLFVVAYSPSGAKDNSPGRKPWDDYTP